MTVLCDWILLRIPHEGIWGYIGFWSSNVPKPQHKHGIEWYSIPVLMWFPLPASVCCYHDAACPQLLGRHAWLEASSSLSFKVVVAGCSVLILCVERSVHWSGCLRKVILSLDSFMEGHLSNPLTHSANTTHYIKGHPLFSLASRWVQLSSQLLWTLPRFCSEFCEELCPFPQSFFLLQGIVDQFVVSGRKALRGSFLISYVFCLKNSWAVNTKTPFWYKSIILIYLLCVLKKSRTIYAMCYFW